MSGNAKGAENKFRGFTLIEMLVVVAIIGILAALLAPGLRKALDSAKIVNCSSNMRQIGTAVFMYSDDNRECIPYYFWRDAAGNFRLSYDDLLSSYAGGRHTQAEKDAASIGTAQSMDIFICPADRCLRSGAPRSYSMPRTGFLQKGVGKYKAGSDTPPERVTLQNIKENSKTILISEWAGVEYNAGSSVYYNNIQGAQGSPLDTPTQQILSPVMLHGSISLNYLFCDGHVRFLNPEDTTGTGTMDNPAGMWSIQPGD